MLGVKYVMENLGINKISYQLLLTTAKQIIEIEIYFPWSVALEVAVVFALTP